MVETFAEVRADDYIDIWENSRWGYDWETKFVWDSRRDGDYLNITV